VNNFGLEQFVTQPTRNQNITDLVFTTHPDLINDINVVPGISDHEAVTFQIKLPLSILPAKQLRKVYQYHKANIDRILEEMNQFSSIFLSQDSHQYPVERNWQQLKHTLLTMVEAHVPHKITSPCKGLPWINKIFKAQMKKNACTAKPNTHNLLLTGTSTKLYAIQLTNH